MTTIERPNIAATPDDFESFHDAWDRLATSHPELGISPGKFSASRFCSRAFATLAEVGAMRRTVSGRYIAHRALFELAAFAFLTCGDVHAAVDTRETALDGASG